jgi:hypothetical protein
MVVVVVDMMGIWDQGMGLVGMMVVISERWELEGVVL